MRCSVRTIYGVMAYIVMAYIVVAYIVMAYIVMAYIVMAYIVMAYIGAVLSFMTTRVRWMEKQFCPWAGDDAVPPAGTSHPWWAVSAIVYAMATNVL